MYKADEQVGAPRRVEVVLIVLVILLVVAASRAIWWGNPAATTDEQLYALIGSALAHGELPYIDMWDRKPFGLFALFALGEWIAPPPYGFQVLAGLFTGLGAWLTYLLARLQVDWVTATGAALLYVILISLYGGFSGQSEVFHAPLMLAMAWLVIDGSASYYGRRALVAMLIGGVALQIKYTVLPQCLFFGLVALWQLHKHGFGLPRVTAMAAAFGVLGVLPTALVGLLYAYAGAFDVWWFSNFESFFYRDGAGRFLPAIQISMLPLLGFGLCGIYLALRGTPLRDPATYVLFIGWTVSAIATVFWPGTVYVYYIAALAAPVVLITLPLLNRKGPASVAPLLIVLLGTLSLLAPIDDWETSRKETASLESLAGKIAPLVDDEASCLWIHDGPTALYTMSQSCLPTRFIYPDHLNNALETDQALGTSQTQEALRLLANKPPVIVTAPKPLTPQNEQVRRALREELQVNYEELGRATSGYRKIVAYRLKRTPDE